MKVLKAAILAASIFLGCIAYVPHVMAQPNVALTAYCGSPNCVAYAYWQGQADGGSSTVNVDTAITPSDFSSFAVYVQFSSPSLLQMQVGYEYKVCGSGLDYFYTMYKIDGSLYKSGCFGVPTGDLGYDTFFGVTHYVSNGGGWNFWINGNASGQTICNPCGVGYTGWTGTDLIQNETDISTSLSSWSGDILGHRDYILSQYHSSTGWHDQIRAADLSFADDPVQLVWSIVPSSSHPGGDMLTCAYSSGISCP